MSNTQKNEISFRVAGENGDGIFSAGDVFSKLCTRSGLNVHAYRSYQSVIRGGHVNYSVRAANWECRAPADNIDILVAIRGDSFIVDAPMMSKNGIILYDSKGFRIKENEVNVAEGVKVVDIPAVELASKFSDLKIVANTVFIGAVAALFDMDFSVYEQMLMDQFGGKGQETVDMNASAAKAGYDWAKENLKPIDHNVEYKPNPTGKMFIGGNESLALGMVNGGLQYFAWYPMTPASPVGQFLASYGSKVGVIVKQMEDEINVSNAVIGASFAGARSACATSGGGFALMTEAIGFSSMAELPVVYIEVARTGPSTGLPTKTEQGDLNQLLGASQGDFPRAIIAQVSIDDGFYLGQEALNIADRYQMPVLIASDLYLGEHFESIDEFDWDRIPIERGKLITEDIDPENLPYQRYKLTEDGISPRTIPGVKYGQHDAGSDEHDEYGKLVSDIRAGYPEAIEVRLQQMDKRMGKLERLREEFPAPTVEGATVDESDVLIVGWGSTLDTIREAREVLEKTHGKKCSHLHIKYILPFKSKETLEILENFKSKGKPIVIVEVNYTGQMRRHIRAETGFHIEHFVRKYDGESLLPKEIVEGVLNTFAKS
jgi:2-oxoglutarate/2-oxoacid ferredoxin oxidoreductase subunit alpha